MALTESQENGIGAVRAVIGAIALFVCLFGLGFIVLFQKFRFPATRLVMWLTVASIIQTIPFVFFHFDPEKRKGLCDIQAFLISFSDWAVSLWVVIIALDLLLGVVFGKQEATTRYQKWYHCAVWGSALFFAIFPFLGGFGIYGPSGAWCWISADHPWWRIWTWYGPLFPMFFFVVGSYLWVMRYLYRDKSVQFYERESEEEMKEKAKTALKLTRYPLIFILVWIFPIINRLQNLISGDNFVLWLVLLHAISVSLQGIANTSAYLWDEKIIHHCTPTGVKSAFFSLINPRMREAQQPQKYDLNAEDTGGKEEAPGNEIKENDGFSPTNKMGGRYGV